MGGHHSPIRRLVKLHPQLVQPQNGLRRLRHQLVQKLLFGGKVTATVGVQEMNGRRIIGLIRSLDPSLGHHGVGVPHPELSGLMVNAGVGLLVLFRVSRNRKENWTVVGLLLLSGILLGSVFGLLFGEIL